MTLRAEILQQPAVLQELLGTQMSAVMRVAAAVHAREIEYVYLAARGTSEHAGIYAQYILGAYNKLPVALAAPSLFTVYERPPQLTRALVVGVSQSGQSPDIVGVITEAQRQGAMTLAVTNDPDSPLARAAAYTLDIRAGVEHSVAATKTYTAELLVFAMLSAALAGDTGRVAELERVPEAARQALELEEQAARAAEHFREMSRCVVLGRGYHFATALEWSLKLKELTYIVADRYSTAEFQHGPIAMIEPGFPVLAVAPSDPGAAAVTALLSHLARERGAQVLALSDDEATLQAATIGLQLPAKVPPWLMPIVSILPAQLFCHHLTIARGIDANTPRGLSKVTLTT
ncbi:MAG: SIS domain-containing protein [Roseiflexaceae bacterium]|nr:SIS domain-containing protein [Roseiflexaceae bacterium]